MISISRANKKKSSYRIGIRPPFPFSAGSVCIITSQPAMLRWNNIWIIQVFRCFTIIFSIIIPVSMFYHHNKTQCLISYLITCVCISFVTLKRHSETTPLWTLCLSPWGFFVYSQLLLNLRQWRAEVDRAATRAIYLTFISVIGILSKIYYWKTTMTGHPNLGVGPRS